MATHNLKSAELALSQVQSNPILKSGVNFAQINGLGDHISMALSLQGCQVLKLLPCGTVDEVLPWLSRYISIFFCCNTLCPEGAENMSLGSQVSDLCF